MSRLGRIPITLRVPALVALLMICVSVAISERVMSRLVESQERQLRDLAASYLDGQSSALIPHVLRDDIWEVYDALDRTRELYGALRPLETVVVDRAGLVIASTDPELSPSLAPLPARFADHAGDAAFVIDDSSGRAYLRRALAYQSTPIGAIHAVVDIGHLLAERSSVITTLLLTNAGLTALLAAIGYLAVRRMVAPVRVLTDHLTSGAAGGQQPISAASLPAIGGEGRRMVEAYNQLVEAERERGELARRLADEERLASLGRLASGLAHEINNPLGGLFNAIDTIKRHGESETARASAVSLLERGLAGIRDVVAATLQTFRPDRSPRPFGPADVEDVRILATPEARRRGIVISWRSDLSAPTALPSAPLRQTLLNLVLNACAAARTDGRPRRGRGQRDGRSADALGVR